VGKLTMEIDEFIDSYSDDMIFLQEARSALLTHPLTPGWASVEHWNACASRVTSILMIGSIEAMLERWRDNDSLGILETYFGGAVANGQRVRALKQAFTDAGIQVDPEVFEDYLAIKYLRNTIIHGHWKESEKEQLEQRHFPTDVRRLSSAHLDRIDNVNQNMMLYIALSRLPSAAGASRLKPDKLVKLEQLGLTHSRNAGIIRPHDLDRIIWNNLERIDAHIYAEIEKVALTERYNWSEGRTVAEIRSLTQDQRQWLFYIAAWRAGEEDYEPLAQHRSLAGDALAFWHEYWQRTFLSQNVSHDSIGRALNVLGVLHERGLPARSWPILLKMPEVEARQAIQNTSAVDAENSADDILNALRTGKVAYDSLPNVMPVTLMTVRLPIVDPSKTADYLREARSALATFTLNRTWYSWVEEQCAPALESLDFYRKMADLLGQRRF
jgi:hypothetical protein